MTLGLALCAPSAAQDDAASQGDTAPDPVVQETEAVPPRIPIEQFGRIPSFEGFRVSPDGSHLVARSDAAGEPRLIVIDLTGKVEPINIGLPVKNELVWYRWAGPNRLLISMGSTVDFFGQEARATRLISYDIRSRATQFLGRPGEGLNGDDLLYVDPQGEWVLLAIQKSIYDYPSVFRIALGTGQGQEVVKQKQDIYSWFSDNAGVVRMGLGFSGSKFRVVYRPDGSQDFKTVAKPKLDDEDAIYDLTRIYQGSDQGYVLSDQGTGRYALYRFNLATREVGEKVFDHPVNDIEDFDTNEDGSELLYARFTDDRERTHWFDPDLASLQDSIDNGLKGRENHMISWNRARNVIMVWTGDSNDPGRYYLFLPTEGVMKRYFVPHPDLRPRDLAKMEPVRYKARDGVEVPAYLTLPKGRDPKGLPLIILPHGGPFQVRDSLGFNTEVQFLANRGYAVLQPNFRGSGGYGKAFSDLGYGQMGRTMQDDLDDGMDWLVEKGIVDPKRVCVMGYSYGGYAAIWGAIRNPERYRCAISFAGVTDLKRQLRYDLNFFIAKKYQKNWREKVQGAENFDLESVSPVQQAARLQVPVLIGHGEDDTNVPFKQGKELVEALRKSGKDFEFINYEDEGHGFDKPEDLQDWLQRVETFLEKNNPS